MRFKPLHNASNAITCLSIVLAFSGMSTFAYEADDEVLWERNCMKKIMSNYSGPKLPVGFLGGLQSVSGRLS